MKFGEYNLMVLVDLEDHTFILMAKKKNDIFLVIANRKFSGENGDSFAFHLGPNAATLKYINQDGTAYAVLEVPAKEERITIPITHDESESDTFMDTDYHGKPY